MPGAPSLSPGLGPAATPPGWVLLAACGQPAALLIQTQRQQTRQAASCSLPTRPARWAYWALRSEAHRPGARGAASGAGRRRARSTGPIACTAPHGSRPGCQGSPGNCRAGNRSPDLSRCGPHWQGCRTEKRARRSAPPGRGQHSGRYLWDLREP